MAAQLTENSLINEVVRNYWIHTRLLLLNTEKKCSSYEWPLHSKNWVWRHPYAYIGNPYMSGSLHLCYHEENFPGMIIRSETLIRQAESPTLDYVLGGTRTNEYPTAFNYQIQGCLPLPDDCTLEQRIKNLNQSVETWYLGKKGATPTGLPRSTCSSVLEWTSCTNVLNVGCWNYGEIQGDHFICGNNKIPRWLTAFHGAKTQRIQGMPNAEILRYA